MTAPAAHAPLRLPDTMLRHDIGPYVRSLREHYGLSQQDVSARLHIRLKYVQAIEASQFEALPGAVYAKGYVHTYAEFLGLDAHQVVERCFGEQPAREVQEHFIPAGARAPLMPQLPKKWLGLVLAAVVAMALYSVMESSTTEEEVIAVHEQAEKVPEDMLAPMRRAVMATPSNHDCLAGRSGLSCFFDSGLTRRWIVPEEPPSYAGIAAANAPSKKKKNK